MMKPEAELSYRAAPSRSFKPSSGAELPHRFRHLTPQIEEESRLVFHSNPRGLAAEQFRLLRRTLNQEFATGAVLMITSPQMGDGKTLTCLNLCMCLADSGDSTLLVEADVRRPRVRAILGCVMEPPGVEGALAGSVEPSKAIRLIKQLSFHAAMVLRAPDDPSHLVSAAGVKRFLEWAREHFRWVVVDAAPALPTADVSELSTLTDGVLLVIRAQSTPRELSKRAIDVLGKRLHGVIFNEITKDSSPYYRYLSDYDQRDQQQSLDPTHGNLQPGLPREPSGGAGGSIG